MGAAFRKLGTIAGGFAPRGCGGTTIPSIDFWGLGKGCKGGVELFSCIMFLLNHTGWLALNVHYCP